MFSNFHQIFLKVFRKIVVKISPNFSQKFQRIFLKISPQFP